MKDHLTARGVEFAAINLQSNERAVEELRDSGIYGLPVVAVGDRYALGISLPTVDEFLGLEASSQDALMTGRELVDRTVLLLRATQRYSNQLPVAHYDDEIPGMEDVTGPLVLPDGTAVYLPDGSPYVPHRTFIGLVRHIVGHGVKFRMLVENPHSDEYVRPELYLPLGEPDSRLSVAEIVELVDALILKIRGVWERQGESGFQTPVRVLWGTHPLQSVLQQNTYSLAQHSRQLMTVILSLGLEPDGPLTETAFRGVTMPKNVWA